MKHNRKNPASVVRNLWNRGKYFCPEFSSAWKKVKARYGKLHFCPEGRSCSYCSPGRTHKFKKAPTIQDWQDD